MPQAALHTGLIVANHGRHWLVEAASGERRICHSRGKKSQAVVGDRVQWLPSQDEGTIEHIEPRRNLLYRQDALRTKSFAANLDWVLVLLAAEPEFSRTQLARAVIAAQAAQIEPVIALNKSDLVAPFERAWEHLAPYRQMGYQVLPLALKPRGPAPAAHAASVHLLRGLLERRTALVMGPSGAGKSTLINLLAPGALAHTAEISQALKAGKHTTTSTTWYWLDAQRQSALIDSPGFQEFGLYHLQAAQLASYMPDLQAHAGDCRFYNCSHLHEPGCAVISAVKSGCEDRPVSASRYQIYSDLYAELEAAKPY